MMSDITKTENEIEDFELDSNNEAATKASSGGLNKEEIDSLLGAGDSGNLGGGNSQSGIGVIVNSALVSYERLPMLEVVYDRLVRLLSTSLRNF